MEQKAANLELSGRVSRLEKTVATKDATKKLTFVERAAKRPTKVAPKNIKDFSAYIRTRPEKQSHKVVNILTPKEIKNPIGYLVRTYNPSDDDNIKVQQIRESREKTECGFALARKRKRTI